MELLPKIPPQSPLWQVKYPPSFHCWGGGNRDPGTQTPPASPHPAPRDPHHHPAVPGEDEHSPIPGRALGMQDAPRMRWDPEARGGSGMRCWDGNQPSPGRRSAGKSGDGGDGGYPLGARLAGAERCFQRHRAVPGPSPRRPDGTKRGSISTKPQRWSSPPRASTARNPPRPPPALVTAGNSPAPVRAPRDPVLHPPAALGEERGGTSFSPPKAPGPPPGARPAPWSGSGRGGPGGGSAPLAPGAGSGAGRTKGAEKAVGNDAVVTRRGVTSRRRWE